MVNPAPSLPLLQLLRCPCCMSRLTPSQDTLGCGACGRAYPLRRRGATLIPRLMRDDPLATLDQDIVVYRNDPESTRLDRRHRVRQIEERERFLAHVTAAHAERRHDMTVARDTMGIAACDRFIALLSPGALVLDLGCGEGAWTRRLTSAGLRVVGMDADERALGRAAGAGATTTLLQADMMEMPLAAGAVDGVWCHDAFSHVRPDRRTVLLRQVNRVLRPDGPFFVRAATQRPVDTVWRYALWRYRLHQPVVTGEDVARLPRSRGGGWRYRAVVDAHTLHALCSEHGLAVLSLRLSGGCAALIARKVRGTHDG